MPIQEQVTEDAKEFGSQVWIYCDQHLRPHMTGWCTVGIRNKTKLDATTEKDAYTECLQKGFKLYGDYKPEPFNLGRPPHLLAKDVLKRIEDRLWEAGVKVSLGGRHLADIEQLIKQLQEATE